MTFLGFSLPSREEKRKILLQILEKIDMLQEEKDLAILAMDTLDDRDFNSFYEKNLQIIQTQPKNSLPYR